MLTSEAMSGRPDQGGSPSPFDAEDTAKNSLGEALQEELRSSARTDTSAGTEVDEAAIDEATRFDIRISAQQAASEPAGDTDIRYVPPGFSTTGELDHTSADLEAISELSPEDIGRNESGRTDPVISSAPPRATQSIEVGQCFARGGMAELYHARRIGGPNHKKRFVMKKLLKELATDPTYVERFKNEAKVTSGLQHAHIIETYELGKHQGQWYIAMEYLPGRDLGNVLNRLHHFNVQCPVEIVLEVAIAVSKALEHVHSLRIVDESGARVVHRDVNPANVMMTWDGRIKLLDFGLAKDPTADLTGGGEMVGKLMYQPPEAIKGGKPSPQWDVYALGLLMFELLSGQAPFGGLMSSSQLMARIVEEELTDIQSLNESVPDSVAKIVHRATAKNPAKRYETMKECRAALERALDAEVGGRGDIRTFMRVLYQEDGKAPPRVQLGPATPRVHGKRSVSADQRPASSPPRPRAHTRAQEARESRKTVSLVVGGVVALVLVSAAMFWVIRNREATGELEIDPSSYIETGVLVRCRSGRVFLDGIQLGQCPTVAMPTSVGHYRVKVDDDGRTVERTIDVKSGELVELDLRGEQN